MPETTPLQQPSAPHGSSSSEASEPAEFTLDQLETLLAEKETERTRAIASRDRAQKKVDKVSDEIADIKARMRKMLQQKSRDLKEPRKASVKDRGAGLSILRGATKAGPKQQRTDKSSDDRPKRSLAQRLGAY